MSILGTSISAGLSALHYQETENPGCDQPPPPDTAAGEAADAPPKSITTDFAALLRSLVCAPHASAVAAQQASEAAERQREAMQLAEQGGLVPTGPQPPATQQELDALAATINAANDDAAVALANNPRAMQIATPQQKAALIKKLMGGHTNGAEEAAIKTILLSCRSFDEMQQVVGMSGGIQEIAAELEGSDLNAVIAHANQLSQRQETAATKAVDLLEQARSPQEFALLYETLGGDELKQKLPKPTSAELLGRLDALGRKFGVSGVGFGMPPEKVNALQAQIQAAIDRGDCDAIVKLSENSDAMRVASPGQKARMIRALQEGWTKDSQDMAIARLLTSCAGKAEFDQVVDMAGGPAILADIDYAEAKLDINKLMGGFDRLDCADERAVAQAYQGVLLPPQVDELTRTRTPSDAERQGVLGAGPGAEDPSNPALADASQRTDALRERIGDAVYDLAADPLARNKLALTNRDRQLSGQPPLDYTALVTQAYQVANDPAFLAEAVRLEKEKGPLDDQDRQALREELLAKRLGSVAKDYGLSEQSMKTLVTAKMGRVLQEGAREVAAIGGDVIQALRQRLTDAERTEGPDSAEARRLRQTIEAAGRDFGQWSERLQVTGATAASLFKVPPSFAEDFLSALSVIGDVLATVVNVIPGVGQAISGAYFGVKAIVGLATGDILGAFKSVLSAVPGFSAAFGAAGAAINTGAKLAQAGIAAGEGIASGNPLAFVGALGSAAGNLGIDLAKLDVTGGLATNLVQHGTRVGGMIDGVARGDVGAVFGAALPTELRALGAGRLADQLEALAAAPGAQVVRQTAQRAGGLLAALAGNDPAAVGEALRRWLPALATHELSGAISGLAERARSLLDQHDLGEVTRPARAKAGEALSIIERIAGLGEQSDTIRRFEQIVAERLSAAPESWDRLGEALLRRIDSNRRA